MKIDFTNQAEIEKARALAGSSVDLQKFDTFLEEVKIFDFNNTQHVEKARKCCENCCKEVTIVFDIN